MYICIYILYTKSATKLLQFLDMCKFIFIFFVFCVFFNFFAHLQRVDHVSITYQSRINYVSHPTLYILCIYPVILNFTKKEGHRSVPLINQPSLADV